MTDHTPGPCPYCQTQMENCGSPIWEDFCPNKSCTGHWDEMFRRIRERPKLVSCPFCGDTDYDLIRLKNHFVSGYCDKFNETKGLFDDA